MAPLSARQLQRNAFLAEWSKVDWSKQNWELAVEMGLSRERIRQVRKQLGAPQPTHPNRWRKTAQALQWAKDNLDKLKGLTWSELQRKYGFGDYWQSSPLHSFLKPFLREKSKHPWAQIDFRLPNRDLALIWRLPPNLVSKQRLKKQIPPPTWRCKPGSGAIEFSGRGQLQAYQRTVKAEERKAARYFAQAAERKAGGRAA